MDENRPLTELENSIKINREQIVKNNDEIRKLKNVIQNVEEQLATYKKSFLIYFNYDNDEYEVRIRRIYKNHIQGDVISKNYRIFETPYEGGFRKDRILKIHN